MTWDTEPEQARTLLGQLEDVDVDGVVDGDSLIHEDGEWIPGRTGRVDFVNFGHDADTPRPVYAELVHWRGNPATDPVNAQSGDFMYVEQGAV